MARKVFERDLDALFVRNLARPEFAQAFLRALEHSGTLQGVETQTRHNRHAGTIDLEFIFTDGRRLLVENKIDAGYSVTSDGQGQPERYAASVAAWRAAGIPAISVLLAPRVYLDSSRTANRFDRRIAYEALRPELSGADLELLDDAIAWASLPYEPDPDVACMDFFRDYAALVEAEWHHLVLKRNPNASGVRPTGSRTIYFEARRMLRAYPSVPQPRVSIQSWDSGAGSPSAKLMIGGWGHLSSAAAAPDSLRDIGAYLRPAGRSLGIVIDTPRMEVTQPLAPQEHAVRTGLAALDRLRTWWNASGEDMADWYAKAQRQVAY